MALDIQLRLVYCIRTLLAFLRQRQVGPGTPGNEVEIILDRRRFHVLHDLLTGATSRGTK